MNEENIKLGQWTYHNDRSTIKATYRAASSPKQDFVVTINRDTLEYQIQLLVKTHASVPYVLFECQGDNDSIPLNRVIDLVVEKYGIPKPEIKEV